MENITIAISWINGIVWGQPMLIILVGVGIYLTVGLKFMPWRKLGYAFTQLMRGRKGQGEGEISPFQALMTALSATIGTGNIIGVAAAILIGGPGAVFWMWITALIGMATKYGEAVLAVKYRQTDSYGNHTGGPMYYIKHGLGARWAWLGYLFAIFGTFAAFGIGNMAQSNAVAGSMRDVFGIDSWITGAVIATLAALVILGGIRRLGAVAGRLVPIMALLYVSGSLIIIFLNIDQVPGALSLIVESAFRPASALGGVAGATIVTVMQAGIARGVFSNEAGLGSAPIAHAAAQTNNPVRQGVIGMLGTFIDTIIVCSMTAIVIIMSGLWQDHADKTTLSQLAYGNMLGGFEYVVIFGIIVFAFTTILGWSYYGERCAQFLLGDWVIMPYRFIWIAAAFFGASLKFDFVLLVSDTLNAFMAIPNLIALALLSPVIFKITKEYFSRGE